MFLLGEAGIGKSRLIEVIANDAVRSGLPVLRGRAVQTATPAAFRPLTEALSSAVRAGAPPDAADLGPLRATLGRLLPEWRPDGAGVTGRFFDQRREIDCQFRDDSAEEKLWTLCQAMVDRRAIPASRV